MKVKTLLYKNYHRLRTIWRILIFCFLLAFATIPLLFIGNSLLQFLGVLIILVFGLYLNSRYLDKRNFSDYGLVFKRITFVHFFAGILIGTLSVFVIFSLGLKADVFVVSKATSLLNLRLVFLFVLKMLLVAIVEETFFRGYLFTTIYNESKSKPIKKMSLIIAIIVSSAAFGLAHFSNNHSSITSMILLSINGMVWCTTFIISRNLGLSIGLHTSWNFTQSLIGFTMSGNKPINSLYNIDNQSNDLISGGAYGPEAGVLGLLGFMAMLLMSLTYLKLAFPNNI